MVGPTRKIGSASVPAIGYGAMGLAAFYGKPKSQKECDEVFSHLISHGCTHWDTSDIYSSAEYGKLGENETQIGTFFKSSPGAREKVFLASKHIFTIGAQGMGAHEGSREYAHEACEASLKRIGTDHLDLFYLHRPSEPIEESIKGMKELKDQGKIKFIGVSEYNVEQLERANKVAHIDALQIEFSVFTPEIAQNGILDWCKKNGTTVVAYSPLGRGFLSGRFKSPDDFEDGDFRKNSPRFTGENFNKNLELVKDLEKIAKKKGCTSGQVALAWVLSHDGVVAIPGSTSTKNIDENVEAGNVKLTPEELKEIDGIINSFKVSGDRYPQAMMGMVAF